MIFLGVKIFWGNYEILTSGIALTFTDFEKSNCNEFKVELSLSEDFHLALFLKIEENGGERDLQKTIEEDKIYITCYNFGLGAGTIVPMHIATFLDKAIYFHFSLESVLSSQKVYSLTYTIYMEQ